MRKQISYNEYLPQFDDITHERLADMLESFTVIADDETEYAAHMAAITNPARDIPQDSIVVTELPPTVEELKAELVATDYKIIKCSEYQLAGLDAPYDIAALHEERQTIRDKINGLEE